MSLIFWVRNLLVESSWVNSAKLWNGFSSEKKLRWEEAGKGQWGSNQKINPHPHPAKKKKSVFLAQENRWESSWPLASLTLGCRSGGGKGAALELSSCKWRCLGFQQQLQTKQTHTRVWVSQLGSGHLLWFFSFCLFYNAMVKAISQHGHIKGSLGAGIQPTLLLGCWK